MEKILNASEVANFEIDMDRLRESYEPFLEIQKPLNARHYQVNYEKKDLNPKEMQNGTVVDRTVVGKGLEYSEKKLQKLHMNSPGGKSSQLRKK